MSISFIVPTIGRDTLGRTLRSIERFPNDEILVEVDSPPSGRWGNDQRNIAMRRAICSHLAFIDDDDFYVKGHRKIMEEALKSYPDRPHLFRIKYPNGDVIWDKHEIIPGNISTQMILVPNSPKMLYHWEKGRNMADFIFVNKWQWPQKKIVWHEEIITLMGHDYE